ncbi:acyltransferase family protein, partial [Basilea psittacipulmonis]
MSSINYRSDIDGLRAIAVLSVIIFHLNASYLPGGFLGVDIFFVISGYLITKIIRNSLVEGNFSFKDFYNRRLKRIYPNFIFVIWCVFLVATFLFRRSDFGLLKQEAEFSVIFLANIFFAKLRHGYFDPITEENSLIHIWSLAVEEQFYFIFPFLFFCIYKWFSKKTKTLLLIFTAFILISVLLSFIPRSFYTKFSNIYYLPQLRFFELLIGSALSLIVSEIKTGNKQSFLADLISGICLCGLFLCFYWYREDMKYVPGMALLLPCFMTAGLIYFAPFSIWIKKLLSFSVLVKIGLLSYSLYLWHWPIITFFKYVIGTQDPFTPIQLLVISVLTVLLSIFSYIFIEQKCRYTKFSFKKTLLLFYFLPSVLLLGYTYTLNKLKAQFEIPPP